MESLENASEPTIQSYIEKKLSVETNKKKE